MQSDIAADAQALARSLKTIATNMLTADESAQALLKKIITRGIDYTSPETADPQAAAMLAALAAIGAVVDQHYPAIVAMADIGNSRV